MELKTEAKHILRVFIWPQIVFTISSGPSVIHCHTHDEKVAPRLRKTFKGGKGAEMQERATKSIDSGLPAFLIE